MSQASLEAQTPTYTFRTKKRISYVDKSPSPVKFEPDPEPFKSHVTFESIVTPIGSMVEYNNYKPLHIDDGSHLLIRAKEIAVFQHHPNTQIFGDFIDNSGEIEAKWAFLGDILYENSIFVVSTLVRLYPNKKQHPLIHKAYKEVTKGTIIPHKQQHLYHKYKKNDTVIHKPIPKYGLKEFKPAKCKILDVNEHNEFGNLMWEYKIQCTNPSSYSGYTVEATLRPVSEKTEFDTTFNGIVLYNVKRAVILGNEEYLKKCAIPNEYLGPVYEINSCFYNKFDEYSKCENILSNRNLLHGLKLNNILYFSNLFDKCISQLKPQLLDTTIICNSNKQRLQFGLHITPLSLHVLTEETANTINSNSCEIKYSKSFIFFKFKTQNELLNYISLTSNALSQQKSQESIVKIFIDDENILEFCYIRKVSQLCFNKFSYKTL